jgi:hypothetical protein
MQYGETVDVHAYTTDLAQTHQAVLDAIVARHGERSCSSAMTRLDRAPSASERYEPPKLIELYGTRGANPLLNLCAIGDGLYRIISIHTLVGTMIGFYPEVP